MFAAPRPSVRFLIVATFALPLAGTGVLAGGPFSTVAAAAPQAPASPAAPRTLPTTLPETIPIFPLEDAMLFPDMSVPLRIFEPRYRAMVGDVLKGNRIIGMVQLRPGYEADYERSPSIFPFGCAGVITDIEMQPNGEYTLVLQAFAKFRVTREEASRPYRVAHVTRVDDTVAASDRAALHAQRERLASILSTAGGRLGFRKIPDGISDEQYVNGVSQLVLIDPIDRERLLEQNGPLPRATLLVDLITSLLAAPVP